MIFTEQYIASTGRLVENEFYVAGDDPFIAAIKLCQNAGDYDRGYFYIDEEGIRRVRAFKNFETWYIYDELYDGLDFEIKSSSCIYSK